jgi:2-hydroxychromene-2-carboxylate isomerase
VLPGPVEWQPVLARELPEAETFEAFRCQTEIDVFRAEIQRRAEELGLQPLRWPAEFPFDSELAMLVATYAKSIGRVVPFAQAAFRQAFAAGRSLADQETILIAGAACEMHPQAILRATELRSVHKQLAATTAQAARAGVGDVPAVLADLRSVRARVFTGERALEDAARHRDSPGAALKTAGTAGAEAPRSDSSAGGSSIGKAAPAPPAAGVQTR